MRFLSRSAFLFLVQFVTAPVSAQVIDFETLPDGTPTVDVQQISDQYALFGVTFTLLDRTTGEPIGFPRIAKSGAPQTAFEGCESPDTPRPYVDLGTSFLTDGTAVGVEGDLRIEYVTPVTQASGVILDIDCRVNGGPPCEQWTITAYDAFGAVVQTAVLDAPVGPVNPECTSPQTGPGDSEAFGWVVGPSATPIQSIVLRYTGTATNVGLAFDAFSVASIPGPPDVTVSSPVDTVCAGERIDLSFTVAGGVPPYSFQWQQESGPSTWTDLGTGSTETVEPLATTRYRVVVTDVNEDATTSAPVELTVVPGDPLCATSLWVASYNNDRVVRYSFRSQLASVFVASGSGGLNGTSKIACGPDGHLYVSSQLNDRVLRYDGETGDFLDVFVAAGSGGLDLPVGLAFGSDGNLYVVSNLTGSVLRYAGDDGSFLDAFVAGSLDNPTGIVFGPDGDLFVSSLDGDRVLRFDGDTGTLLGDFVSAGSGGLDAPRGLVFGPDGNLYVGGQNDDGVRRYDGSTGAFLDVFVPARSGGLDRANDVLFGPDGHLYVAGFDNGAVLRYDGVSGAFLGALPAGLLNGPAWLASSCAPIPTSVSPPDVPATALDLRVEPAVPNPFNPRTTVAFTLGSSGRTLVRVIDAAGRHVATLLDDHLVTGRHEVRWNGRTDAGSEAASGIYFVSVQSGELRRAAKIVLVR